MNRVLKICLLWLLALALPMQTYAAATTFACGTTPGHTAETVVEAAAMDHATMQHGGPEFLAHDSMHHAAHSHESSNVRPHKSHSSADHRHSPCSICAACCVGIAMMPAAIDWHPPHVDTEMPLTALVVSFSGHIPPGIDRPPRTIFA